MSSRIQDQAFSWHRFLHTAGHYSCGSLSWRLDAHCQPHSDLSVLSPFWQLGKCRKSLEGVGVWVLKLRTGQSCSRIKRSGLIFLQAFLPWVSFDQKLEEQSSIVSFSPISPARAGKNLPNEYPAFQVSQSAPEGPTFSLNWSKAGGVKKQVSVQAHVAPTTSTSPSIPAGQAWIDLLPASAPSPEQPVVRTLSPTKAVVNRILGIK